MLGMEPKIFHFAKILLDSPSADNDGDGGDEGRGGGDDGGTVPKTIKVGGTAHASVPQIFREVVLLDAAWQSKN